MTREMSLTGEVIFAVIVHRIVHFDTLCSSVTRRLEL